MNDDQLDDLKQFIDYRISQTEMRVKEDIAHVESKVDDVDMKIDTISDTLHTDLHDQDVRITKLEERLA